VTDDSVYVVVQDFSGTLWRVKQMSAEHAVRLKAAGVQVFSSSGDANAEKKRLNSKKIDDVRAVAALNDDVCDDVTKMTVFMARLTIREVEEGP
jgi:hypothetical protein